MSLRQSCLTPLAIDDVIDAEGVEALGHRVVVIVQAPLRADVGHAGVLVDGVVVLDPLVGFLDARVVLGDAAIDHALDAGVGHAAVAGQGAVVERLIDDLGGAAGRGGVDEAAVVDELGPGAVVVFRP